MARRPTPRADLHRKQAQREAAGAAKEKTAAKPVEQIAHKDQHTKAQTHRGDAGKPGATNFVAVPHHDAKSGYARKFVPATPAAQKKAQALLAKDERTARLQRVKP